MGFSKFGNEGGSGGHFGEGGGFTPFEGKPGPPSFGGQDGYCNLKVMFNFIIDVRVIKGDQPGSANQTRITAEMGLQIRKRCEAKAAKEEAKVRVVHLEVKKQESSSDSTIGESTPKNHKELCSAFIPLTPGPSIPGGSVVLIDPQALPELLKDLSNASNEIDGDFSLGDFMDLQCRSGFAVRGADIIRPVGSWGFYSITLTCTKNLDTCDLRDADSSYYCKKDYFVDLKMPGWIPNQPFGTFGSPGALGGHKANIDPCDFSNLLDCWKENPDVDTTIPDSTAISIGLGLGTAFPPPQHKIDAATKKGITALQKKCKKKK